MKNLNRSGLREESLELEYTFEDEEFRMPLLSLVVEAGSLKGRLTDLRYHWICLFLTGD